MIDILLKCFSFSKKIEIKTIISDLTIFDYKKKIKRDNMNK
jgi:hypothetical protein